MLLMISVVLTGAGCRSIIVREALGILTTKGGFMIDLLRSRRSIRRYEPKAVPAELRDILVEALLRAPSSRDYKPWEFVLVDDRALLKQLAAAKEHGSQFLDRASLGIVICADSRKSDVWVEDCSIAAILVQMTAHSLGLGSCWVQIRKRKQSSGLSSERYVRRVLGLPSHMKVEAIISIGYPAAQKKPVPGSVLAYDKVRLNHYANSYAGKASGKRR